MISWLLAFHIIGLVLWLGGLMTLSRLCGVHSSMANKDARAALIPFERKSYWIGVFPGFILTLGTGIAMLLNYGMKHYFSPSDGFWGATFHLKMTLVLIIIILDQMIAFKMRKLHKTEQGSKAFFMATHGIIGLLFIAVVILIKTRIMV